jgi:hypothetical protein
VGQFRPRTNGQTDSDHVGRIAPDVITNVCLAVWLLKAVAGRIVSARSLRRGLTRAVFLA